MRKKREKIEVGQRFGKYSELLVARVGEADKRGTREILCICDCGAIFKLRSNKIRDPNVTWCNECDGETEAPDLYLDPENFDAELVRWEKDQIACALADPDQEERRARELQETRAANLRRRGFSEEQIEARFAQPATWPKKVPPKPRTPKEPKGPRKYVPREGSKVSQIDVWQTYGGLYVLKDVTKPREDGRWTSDSNRVWLCACKCGRLTTAYGSRLAYKSKKSCGCKWGMSLQHQIKRLEAMLEQAKAVEPELEEYSARLEREHEDVLGWKWGG